MYSGMCSVAFSQLTYTRYYSNYGQLKDKNKMKSTELRIGNFIHHNIDNAKNGFVNDYLTVCEIYKNGISTEYKNEDESIQRVLGKKNYNPIPLTEEWIVKFGFERRDVKDKISYEKHYPYWMRLKKGLKRNGYAFVLEGFKGYAQQIRYIHQLQNLYFAMYGKELELHQ